MRKQFFRAIDSVLPRWVALIPYLVALWVMKLFLGLGMSCRVWNRNSTRSGAFIFGVSDLDVTVVARKDLSFELLRNALSVFKRIFVFLGETNLYHESHMPFISHRINPFELARDPELRSRYAIERPFTQEAKFVFTQRMLFADIHTLKSGPELRQSKWKNHFDLISYPTPEFIDLGFVVKALKDLSGHNQRVADGLDRWLEIIKPGIDIYQAPLPEGFRILAPHCYLWFHFRDDNELLVTLTQQEKDLVKTNIDWEYCGLYTQRFHMNCVQVREHLNRLVKVYEMVSSKEESKRLELDIALAF